MWVKFSLIFELLKLIQVSYLIFLRSIGKFWKNKLFVWLQWQQACWGQTLILKWIFIDNRPWTGSIKCLFRDQGAARQFIHPDLHLRLSRCFPYLLSSPCSLFSATAFHLSCPCSPPSSGFWPGVSCWGPPFFSFPLFSTLLALCTELSSANSPQAVCFSSRPCSPPPPPTLPSTHHLRFSRLVFRTP